MDEYTSDLCFPLKRDSYVTVFTWAHPPEPDVLAFGFALFCWSSSSRPNAEDFDELDFLDLPFPLYRLPCDDLGDPEMLSL